MTTQEIANRLVELCRQGQNLQAINELYHDDIHSIEASGEPREVKGIASVRGKSEWWSQTFEVLNGAVSDPQVADNFFSVAMSMDTKHKESGAESHMEEICVYEVKDGKIVKEQFFYTE